MVYKGVPLLGAKPDSGLVWFPPGWTCGAFPQGRHVRCDCVVTGGWDAV